MALSLTDSVQELAQTRALENPHWHAGQATFNALEELRPDLASALKASDIDPYYSPSRLEAFYTWLSDQAGDQPPV